VNDADLRADRGDRFGREPGAFAPLCDAVELLQQTFAELLETLTRHDDLQIDHPRAFLFTIATRQLGATYQRRQRRPQLDDNATIDTLPAEAEVDDLEYAASLRAEQRLLLRAMRRLDHSETHAVSEPQILLYLRFWAGLTLLEVATIFGVPPGTISGRQRRALQQLERHLAELDSTDAATAVTSTTLLHRWQDALQREVHGRNHL